MTQMFREKMRDLSRILYPSRRPVAVGVSHAGVFGVQLMACTVAVWGLALLSLAMALPLDSISAADSDEFAANKLQRTNGDA
jgi:hypothetical protein